MSAIVLTELLKYELKDYLEKNLEARYSFFRRVSAENIMKWQSKEISFPLSKLTVKELHPVSIQLFRSIIN